MTHLSLLPLLAPVALQAGTLSMAAVPIAAGTSCLAVDQRFQAEPDCASLVVVDPDRPGQVGLVSRPRFLQVMAGRYGFGRALFGRAAVGSVALWGPVVVDAKATIQQAASAVLQRPAEGRYDDLVVRCPDGSWGTLSAATVLEALSRTLAEQAMYDGLTGMANREVLLAELGRHCAAPLGGTALLFLDLDRFKQVNDVHGHNAGDALLQVVADRLRGAARDGDLVARLGGDEFAVLLTGLPRRESDRGGVGQGEAEPTRTAADVARRMLAALTRPVPVGGGNVLVGASIGVAIAAPTGSDPDTLLREADLAMYQAKRAGGDRVQLVTSVGFQLESRLPGLAIDDTLRRALADGQFVLHYQPIVDLRTGTTRTAEALIRWQHPQHGLVPPGQFLPAAQASGFVITLDRWVLGEACRQLAAWDEAPDVVAPACINVNVSTPHLADPDLVEHVVTALRSSGLPAHRLRLELPETAELSELQAALPALNALQAEGVRLTLDDLGAGSSTLRHLSDLPLDGVKIDRSFVGDLLANDRDTAVVRLLVDLAHNLGLKVTAEGIETAEQLHVLRALGCSYGQGFHLGRPVPATDVPAWLRHPVARQHRASAG